MAVGGIDAPDAGYINQSSNLLSERLINFILTYITNYSLFAIKAYTTDTRI